jgi:amino acid adenylation domain-containing protein
MGLSERLGGLSPQERSQLALRLSRAKRPDAAQTPMTLPEVRPDPHRRCEPFPLNDIQHAYLVGSAPGMELGNISCQSYAEVEVVDWHQAKFEAAVQQLVQRHDMLRCQVHSDGRQQVLAQVPAYRVQVFDLRALNVAAAAKELQSVRRLMAHSTRSADRWPLFDFRVSLIDAHRSRLHMAIDLLIADNRSFHIFIGELARLYRDPDAVLAPLEVTFRDYLAAANSIESTSLFRDAKEYWLQRAANLPPCPELPLAKNPAAVTRSSVQRHVARIPAAHWQALKEKSARMTVTPAGILAAGFAEVLAIWSKSPRFTINLTLFNRLPLHPQTNDIIGDFTSISLLEIDNTPADTFEARARRHQQQLWQDLNHREFSGIRVMREMVRLHGGGPRALMPVVFTSLLNLDGGDGVAWSEKLGPTIYAVTQTPQVYLDCIVHEDKGDLVLNWDAVDEVFPAGVLDDMLHAYETLLMDLASGDAAWRASLARTAEDLIPPAQLEMRKRINQTSAPESDELLHTLFLEQVRRQPNQIAVSTPSRQLTYRELYEYACAVENELLARGAQPGQLVAVLMEKGWEQVAGVLGILLAGAAYLPVDSDLPSERQRYLIENGEVKIVLTQSGLHRDGALPAEVEQLDVDRVSPSGAAEPVARGRQSRNDLAYVIYTSGSTGVPKGVMIDHRGAVNTVLDINQRFGVGPGDRVLALSRLNFDLSVYDIFGVLAAGGTIVMPAATHAMDPAHWVQRIASENVTVWNTVPALMDLLAEEAVRSGRLSPSLRLVMMSGDWIPTNLPGRIREVLPEAKIMSLGGATEASIWSILYPIERIDPAWKSIPYGTPMVNQTLQILSSAGAPSPVWVPGNLHIGGIGLAKGYWRDDLKTNASFVAHPVTGERLYRTGDLGRYLPDGNIEFLGREDFQVKVQGHRIELGEIEIQLQAHESVEAAAVVVREDIPGEKRLVGYVVAKAGMNVEIASLRTYLRAKLPEYMVPAIFVRLDALPLTANGKWNRADLPAPTSVNRLRRETAERPKSPVEQRLAAMVGKLLGVEEIGVEANFFMLGGYSLLGTRLIGRVRDAFGVELTLQAFFEAPTIAEMGAQIEQLLMAKVEAMSDEEAEQTLALLSQPNA